MKTPSKAIAMRDAFGQALVDLGPEMPELVVLDADVSSSTKTAAFGKAFPDRFFNVGVAEANMADVAAGMATCGRKDAACNVSSCARLPRRQRRSQLRLYE